MYEGTSTIVGPLQEGNKVSYRSVFSKKENWLLRAFIFVSSVSSLSLIGWMIYSIFSSGQIGLSEVFVMVCTGLLVVIEAIRCAQTGTLAFFASCAKDPVPLRPKDGLRVAVLTTIVPGKEPLPLVVKTLKAMKEIRYAGGRVDVWLLDEGDDPVVKAACFSAGVLHFSRKDRPKFNQPAGSLRARTKHGNHNAWRQRFEQQYDVVAQMDPDHVPTPDFLERTLGYFNDPDTAFVVAPQVYGNLAQNWIARGSAILAYVFHGIIQRGGNGLQAPLLIGTNHLYRTECFNQFDGYQDCIIEDHLTSMKVYATINSRTGNYWKGVYTPDIIAVGEGPVTYTDFFSQQMRWAYGIWEIAMKHSPGLFPQMKGSQRWSFVLLQMFYPSVALSWILSNLVTVLYMFGGIHTSFPIDLWLALWGTSVSSGLGLFFWLRRFNLVEHERKDSGLIGMALMLFCIPVYTAAAIKRLTGRPFGYVVTAKGKAASADGLQTFKYHIYWAWFIVGILILSLLGIGSTFLTLRVWLVVNLAICIVPIIVSQIMRLFGNGRKKSIQFDKADTAEIPAF